MNFEEIKKPCFEVISAGQEKENLKILHAPCSRDWVIHGEAALAL
jgi:hypothetical protein